VGHPVFGTILIFVAVEETANSLTCRKKLGKQKVTIKCHKKLLNNVKICPFCPSPAGHLTLWYNQQSGASILGIYYS
jgi:hypothetical protein